MYAKEKPEKKKSSYHYEASVGTSLFTLPTKHLSTLLSNVAIPDTKQVGFIVVLTMIVSVIP